MHRFIPVILFASLLAPVSMAGSEDCNGEAAFRFSDDEVAVNEALDSVTLLVERSGGDVACGGTMEWATEEGTATAGDDFESADGEVSIPPYTDQMPIEIRLLDDGCREASEDLRISLSSDDASIDGPSIATVVIVDDDPAMCVLRFANDQIEADEGDGAVSVLIVRTGPLDGRVSVDYGATAATAGPGDFSPQGGTAILAPGASEADVTLSILDDDAEDGSKTVRLTLRNPMGGAVLGDPRTATLTIFDDDPHATTASTTSPAASPTTSETATDATAGGDGGDGDPAEPEDEAEADEDSPAGLLVLPVALLAAGLLRRRR